MYILKTIWHKLKTRRHKLFFGCTDFKTDSTFTFMITLVNIQANLKINDHCKRCEMRAICHCHQCLLRVSSLLVSVWDPVEGRQHRCMCRTLTAGVDCGVDGRNGHSRCGNPSALHCSTAQTYFHFPLISVSISDSTLASNSASRSGACSRCSKQSPDR